MALTRENLLIVSDTEDSSDDLDTDDEATIFVRPVQPVSASELPVSTFNVQAVPIAGSHAVPARSPATKRRSYSTRSSRVHGLRVHGLRSPDQANDADDEDDPDETMTLFLKEKGSKTPVVLSDFEADGDATGGSVRHHKAARKLGVPYRTTAYDFSDEEGASEIQQNEVLMMKKRNLLLDLFLLGIIGLFQGVGFLLYFPDILLLNTGGVSTQYAVVFGLLVTGVLSMLVSLIIIQVTGQRWAIFLGGVGTALYSCARIFDSPSFVAFSSYVSGLSYGLYAVAIYVYLHQLGAEYSLLAGPPVEAVMAYFTAYVHAWCSAAPFLSSLLRYTFLPGEASRSFHDNMTMTSSLKCGISFCWEHDRGVCLYEAVHGGRPDAESYRLVGLMGSFLVCSLGSAFLAWSNTTEEVEINQLYKNRTLASYKRQQDQVEVCSDVDTTYTLHLLLQPLKCLWHRHMALIVPMFIFAGFQQMLAYSLFVQTYTQCAANLGTSLVMASILSVTSAASSLPIGVLVSHVGKLKVLLPTLVTLLALLLTLLVCPSIQVEYHHVIAAFWGLADGVLQNIILMWPCSDTEDGPDGVVACTRLCQLVGYSLVAFLQLHACNRTILVFSACFLVLAASLYVTMEIRIRLDQRAAKEATNRYVPLSAEASWLPRVNPVHTGGEQVESLTSHLKDSNMNLYGT